MANLNCPHCHQEAIRYRLTLTCPGGHEWTDEADRPNSPEPLDAVGVPTTASTGKTSGMRMPFGKYKGQLMENIPVDYFEWCLAKLEDLSPSLRDEMQNQIDLKLGKGVVRRPEGRIEGKTFKY